MLRRSTVRAGDDGRGKGRVQIRGQGRVGYALDSSDHIGIIMAGALIATVPVLVIFTALQRFIVQSVASAGLKG